MKKILLCSAIAASTLMASGYKIPEQSLNSTALAGAYVSNTTAADAAYFNPANMAFMSTEKHLELSAMYIHLNPVDFKGQVLGQPEHNAQSASEDFVIPQAYLVSAPLGEDEDVRIGLSLNAPGGLSKRWPEGIESTMAEEFTLKVIEVNPTLSYRILDNLAVAAGVRFIYSEGIIKGGVKGTSKYLDMTGSSWDLGYNVALSYKPLSVWGLALTYRSNVDLTEEGGQSMVHPQYGPITLPATVSVPLPATFTFATDVDVTESTNIEFVYERAFWSAYDELDIRVMDQPLNKSGKATPKNWKDTNTFRLGLTQGLGESIDLMVGLTYDETPIPEETIGFELPDSNALVGAMGLRWAMSESTDIGAAVLYDQKEERTVSASTNDNNIDGTFSGASALIVTLGLGYKF